MSHQCENLLDYFNGHLSKADKEQFEKHLAECPECQEELQELQEILGDTALLSEQVSPPPEMKERILANVFAEETVKAEPTPIPVHSTGKKASISKPWLTSFLAASLLLSVLGNGYLLLNENRSGTEEWKQPDNVVKLEPSDTAGIGFATLFQQEQTLSVMIQTQELPALTGSEVYQVWLLKDGTPIPAGSFTVDNQGKGYVLHRIDEAESQEWDTIAITLEPHEGNDLPEGNIHLSAGL
ncbi:anti-sigma factor [Sutcliffiella deserti]|uniref:anti-sigma factor n=1 Tax=Sutcliffiella deserti TaxID=2875501 RepID=UPI001CBAFAF2|nr:anti-sigma factor [Sutcliffiella deserti]